MKKVWDVKAPCGWNAAEYLAKRKKKRLDYQRQIVNEFFAGLETYGGVVGSKAVLFCYNSDAPELSYIITEQL